MSLGKQMLVYLGLQFVEIDLLDCLDVHRFADDRLFSFHEMQKWPFKLSISAFLWCKDFARFKKREKIKEIKREENWENRTERKRKENSQ